MFIGCSGDVYCSGFGLGIGFSAKVLRFVGFAKVWCFSSGNAIGFCGGCVFIGCSGDVYCSGFGLGISFCGGCGLGVLLMVLESMYEALIS